MSAWDTERAYTLGVQALDYLERVYPKGPSLTPLEPYRQAVLEAQDRGDFEAFKESLRELMYSRRRVARETRQTSAAPIVTSYSENSEIRAERKDNARSNKCL